MIKLWLDDLRVMPANFTHWAKTADEAIALLQTNRVIEISFDHDLSDLESETEKTGYTVACFIEEQAYLGNIAPIKWNVHSANPTGAKKIEMAMLNAQKYWKERLKS